MLPRRSGVPGLGVDITNPLEQARPLGSYFHDAAYNPANLEPVPVNLDRELPPPGRDLNLAQILARGPTTYNPQHTIEDEVYNDLENTRTGRLIARYQDLGAITTMCQKSSARVEELSTKAPYTNPHVQRKVQTVLRDWALLSKLFQPSIRKEELWLSSWVTYFAARFLCLRLQLVEGKSGGMVRAITLFNWATILVKCIIRYTRDATGKRDGKGVLLDNRLHAQIRAVVKDLIRDNNLNRFQNKKIYYGRWELLLILGWLLRSSQYCSNNQRMVKMQLACLLMVCFYMLTRPGSLAPFNDDLLRRGLLLRLGDVKLYLVDGIWGCRVSVTINAWKGQGDSHQATSREYILDPVTKAHNVMLDPTVWFVTYMLYRGAFGPQYQTLEDLENCEQAVLEVIPEKRNEPFFLGITSGGLDLIPGKAATPANLSQAVRNAAIAAGLPGASMTAFRRDGGNDYGLKVGAVVARLTMGHTNPGKDNNPTGGRITTFHQYYSVGTGQVPYVGIRTGEIQEKTDEVSLAQLHQRDFMRVAIDAIVNTSKPLLATARDDEGDQEDGHQGSEEELAELAKVFRTDGGLTVPYQLEVLRNPRVVKSRSAVRDCWEEYHACFPAVARSYHHDSTHATQTVSRLLNAYERRQKSPKDTYEREAALRKAIAFDISERRAVVRKATNAMKAGVTLKAFEENRPENTSENRKSAQAVLSKEGDRLLAESLARQKSTYIGVHPSEQLAAAPHTFANTADPAQPVAGPSVQRPPRPPHDDASTGATTFHAEERQMVDEEPYGEEDPLETNQSTLVAPWHRHDDPHAWEAWRASLDRAQEDIEGRTGSSCQEEYLIARDLDLADELLLADQHDHGGGNEHEDDEETLRGPDGGHHAHLHRMLMEAGVPSREPLAAEVSGEADRAEALVNGDGEGQATAVDAQVENPVEEETSGGTEPAPAEEEEVDTLGVPCSALRAVLARDIVEPLERNRLIALYYKAHNNTWLCPLCQKFTHSDAPTHKWSDRSALEHHMRLHTPWHDLELAMVREDGTWKCPSCNTTKHAQQSIRVHLVTKCPNKDEYLEMQAAHAKVNSRAGRDVRREVKVRTQRNNQEEIEFEPDYADPRVARALRGVVLDIRNWDVDKMVDDAIAAGKLTESDRASKSRAFEILREFSQCAWESNKFYSVPVGKP